MSDLENDERRASARLDMEEQTVLASWSDGDKQNQVQRVVCSDISSKGIKIQLDASIALGTIVDIQLTSDDVSTKTFKAEVIRILEQEPGNFELALQFSEK